MPFQVTRFDPTPNPNAVKCILDAPASDRPRSFLKPEDAQGDPIAGALFEITGVTTVLINGDWITVNKTSETPWPAVKDAVSRILAGVETP